MLVLRLPKIVVRHAGYFVFASVTLAAAVGPNLLVLTVVDALWLERLPFPEPDRVVALPSVRGTSLRRIEEAAGPRSVVAGQVITDARYGLRPDLQFDAVAPHLETIAVTPEYFRLLRLSIVGRDFTQDDDRPGAEPVAIVSNRFWARAFGRRPDVVGSVVPARPFPVRLIGVAPPGFEGARRGERADVWVPRALVSRLVPAHLEAANLSMMMMARLAPGDEAADVQRRLLERRPMNRPEPFAVIPLADVFGTPSTPTIVVQETGAAGIAAALAALVLVGGCAALAALVIVHYERRRLELAVRRALGASRARLMNEMARELVLVGAAGVLGAGVVAGVGLRGISAFSLPGGVELGRLDLSLDWQAFLVAVGVTLATLGVAMWFPVRRFTRGPRSGELFTGATATGSTSSHRLRQALLAVIVCATIVVLVTAGLFVRAVQRGFRGAAGFDVEHTAFVAGQVLSPAVARPDTATAIITERTALMYDALTSVPGVDAVAYGVLPIDPDAARRLSTPIAVESAGREHQLRLGRLDGSPELLTALGVPILAGRGLMTADGLMDPVPAVVTASLANRLWPGESPLGQVAVTSWRGGRLEIVGIAGDFAFGSLVRPADGVVITARSSFNMGLEPAFVIRSAHPESVVRRLENAVRAAVPEASWVEVSTGREVVARDRGGQRLGAWFFSGFGVTALLLGVGSVFGLVAYVAETRKRDLGVRIALGATTGDVVRHGIGAALIPVCVGTAVGLGSAALLSQLLAAALVGVSPLDLATYVAVGAIVLVSASLAALHGGWRLRSLTPVDALRTN